ncbi:MAG: Crp/Fnr family transcriptional regulator [Hyphomicrobiaceae bacterium]
MTSAHDLIVADRNLLIAHPMFSRLDESVVVDLIKGATSQRYQKNQLIFSTGDIATSFFVVAEGGVRLFRLEADGSEATVNMFHRGQSFGEAAIFLERAYPVMAQTIEASRLIRVDASVIIARIKSDPALALGLLASMSSHLRALVDEITLLRVPTAVRRAAEFLLRNCPATEGSAEFELPHNKSLLAKRLDIAPEVLSRALAELRKTGVSVKRKTVVVDDVAKLYRLARREQ